MKPLWIPLLLLITTPLRSQFYEPRVIAHGHGLVNAAEILDVNHDGMEDIIMTRTRETPEGTPGTALYVYEAYMDGTEIAYSSTFTQIPNAGGLFKIDYDFDGDIDFLMEGGPNIWHLTHYLIENKEGVFSVTSTLPSFLKDSLLDIRSVKDIDHDGYPEILYAKDGLYSASMLPGGEVIMRELIPDFPNHELTNTGDFNHDGYDDLVILDKDKRDLYVWLTESGFQYDSTVMETNFGLSKVIGVDTYSGDGHLEILVYHYPESQIRLIRPDILGGDPTYRVVVSDFPFSASFYAADFNADGFDDFAAGVGISSYYLNDGTGNFTEVPNDIRNDLAGQIIATIYDLPEHKATIYLNAETIEKYTYDDGQYDLKQVPIPDLYLTTTFQMETDDINRDGIQDIVVCIIGDVGGIAWIEGKAGKTFGDLHPIQIDEIGVTSFSLQDFDGDGQTDILYANESSGMVKIKYGNGTGKYCCTREILHGSGTSGGVESADFEDDGFPDIMFSSRASGEVWLIRNHNGVFQSPEIILPTACFLHDVRDLDFDGDPDVFIHIEDPNSSAVLVNDGLGHFVSTDLNLPFFREKSFHDFDFDGQEEYIAFGNTIVIHKFNGTQYEEWRTIETPEWLQVQFFSVIDYNKDGYDDLLIKDYSQPFQLFLNDKNQGFIDDGLFNEKFGTILPNNDLFMNIFSGEDLDTDGDIDFFYDYSHKYYWVSQILGNQTLSGKTYWDLNQDGLQDTTENGIRDMKISATNAIGFTTSTFSDEHGDFKMAVDTGTYQLQLTSLSSCWKTNHENPFSIIVAEAETDSIEMPFYIEGNEHKVFGSMTNGIARCNQEVVFTFRLNNDGCKVLNGQANIIIDPLINTFVPLATIPFEVNGRHITFRADSLLPGESRVFKISMLMPGPEFLGNVLSQRLYYLYDLADGTAHNLEYGHVFQHIIRCAYDPNDKIASPDRSITLGDQYVEGEDLFYTIRFQNTGNDTAFTVRLEDTLSPLLDLASFRAIDASHPFRVVLNEETRLLVVLFDDIRLPDSTTNLAASQGYFAFTIRPLNNHADFTTIYNEAGIYFDLNPPILTNTTKLIYVSDLSILEMSTEGTDVQPLNVYPNPSSGIFHLDVVIAMKDIEVYDMLGQRIYFNTTNNYIDLSGKPEGIYCVVLKNEGSKFIGRLVVDR